MTRRQRSFGKARQLGIAVLCLSSSWVFAFDKPTVSSFSPQSVEIPSNTLRLYVQFSESMALGQARDKVALLNADGHLVKNPFLNLGRELWDRDQKVLTLLFDPGRIKRGVGPNVQSGPPLVVGDTYRLLIKESMLTAEGSPLTEDLSINYKIGQPVREPFSLKDWKIEGPDKPIDALTIRFDRLMDSMAVLRLITVVTENGELVRGRYTTNGAMWEFVPDKNWVAQSYQVFVSAELEDVSGNTMSAPFDAPAGTIEKPVSREYLEFEYIPSKQR